MRAHAPRRPHRPAADAAGTGSGPKPIVNGPDTEPPLFVPADDLRQGQLRQKLGDDVVHSTREGWIFNVFVGRYGYRGCKTLAGRPDALRRPRPRQLARRPCSATPLPPGSMALGRDSFTGWTPDRREKNLPARGRQSEVPANCILDRRWPNLGSHVLAIESRRLPFDWTERYDTDSRADRNRSSMTMRYTGSRLSRVGLDPNCRDRPGPGPATTGTRNEPIAQKGHVAPGSTSEKIADALLNRKESASKAPIGSGEQAFKRITDLFIPRERNGYAPRATALPSGANCVQGGSVD